MMHNPKGIVINMLPKFSFDSLLVNLNNLQKFKSIISRVSNIISETIEVFFCSHSHVHTVRFILCSTKGCVHCANYGGN
jgi:hypothetical protein